MLLAFCLLEGLGVGLMALAIALDRLDRPGWR